MKGKSKVTSLKKHIDIVLACGFYSVTVLVLLSMLNLQVTSFLACSLGVIWIIGKRFLKKPLFLEIITLLTLMLVIGIFHESLLEASSFIIHTVLEKMAMEQNIIISSILNEQSTNVKQWAELVIGIISLPIAMFISKMMITKQVKWLVIGAFFIWLLQLLTGWIAGFYMNALLCWILVITILFSFQSWKVFLHKSTVLSVIIGIAVMISNYTDITNNYERPTFLENLSRGVEQAILDKRFEKQPKNTLSEGDFQRLGSLQLNDDEALRVVMENPQPLYLKGFVGSTYTKHQWETLDGQLAFASKPLLDSLANEHFTPFNQLNMAVEAGQLLKDKVSKVKIQNTQANSQYIFTPYELASIPNEVATYKDETAIHSTSLFGKRQYEFEIMPMNVAKYPQIANALYSLKEEEQLNRYVALESHYNEYVYNHFLQMPNETKVLLENHLQEHSFLFNERPSYEVAIDTVRSFVATELTYREDVVAKNPTADFLMYVLESSREGYASHFATLATMVFRYYGIPARYVEGYLITPEIIKDKEAYSEIVITSKNTHAWPEIYIDLVGWVPVEVTPTYLTTMPAIDMDHYPSGNDLTPNAKNSETPTQSEGTASKKEVKDDEQHAETASEQYERSLNGWLSLVLVMLITMFAVVVLYMFYKKYKQIQLFRSPNNKVAITQLFAYTMKMLVNDGMNELGGSNYQYSKYISNKYGEHYADLFNNALAVQQQVLYSQHDPTNEQKEIMLRFKNEMKQSIANQKSYLIRKIYLFIR